MRLITDLKYTKALLGLLRPGSLYWKNAQTVEYNCINRIISNYI